MTSYAAAEAVIKHRPRCEAWHLLLDKMCVALEAEDPAMAKTSALVDVRKCYSERSRRHLERAVRSKLAWLDRLERQFGEKHSCRVVLEADSKLLVHLGRAHVLENVGLAFDHTTGLPWIPGTAVKGVVSTWATWIAAEEQVFASDPPHLPRARDEHPSPLAKEILGDDSAEGSEHAGEIVFVGGFPETVPTVDLDIVNPHHEVDGSPKKNLAPNVFLCVAPQPRVRWRFLLLARVGAANPTTLLDTAAGWLVAALTQLGIGAKTAAGYGHFRVVEQAATGTTQAAVPASDFTEKSFAAVISRMNNPGQAQLFQRDIALLKEPRNSAWLAKLKQVLASPEGRDARRRLRDKEWFPQNWLPSS